MALTRRIGFARFDRWGTYLGRLGVTEATHHEALDGTDEITITCSDEVNKGDYIVWLDLQGKAHEHIVDTPERTHNEDGTVSTTFTALNSIAETWDDWINDVRPTGTVATALTSALKGTRWGVGSCDLEGTATKTLYHESVREGISDILSTWGGELETEIGVTGAAVASRKVAIKALRGNQSSPKRFAWTKDVRDVKRSVASDNPKTRVYGYGKGVETEGGGYGRRLTFGDVNGGQDYVEDADATNVWGHPGPNGTKLPACTSYINEECEDAHQLLEETRAYLEQVKQPSVTYTASVLDLAAFGRDWEGVALGDCVAVIDKGFSDEGLRLSGRVSEIERDLLSGDATVTFGTLTDSMADMWQSVTQKLQGSQNKQALYDAVASASPGWLTELQGALNDQFRSAGTYKVETFELGSIYSNVALDSATGRPLQSTAGMWAVNISGRGIRLASGLNAQGEWDWATFITGDTVTADAINAGTMKADRIRAGMLTDELGRNWWDLTNGELRISTQAMESSGIASVDNVIGSVTIEYALSDSPTEAPLTGWQTVAPEWQNDKSMWQRVKTTDGNGYVTYSDPVCIDGAIGKTGEPGEAGAAGTGVSQIEEQWYLSTSATECAGGSWTTAQPAWQAGHYIWARTKVTWTDATITFTDPVLAKAINTANQSAADANTKVEELDSELDQQGVFERLTNGGEAQGLYIEGGKLFVNATYMRTGVIDCGNGAYWDLTTGDFSTVYVISETLTGSTSVQNTYRQSLVVIDMTTDTPLGIYAAQRYRYEVIATGKSTYGSISGKSMKGGVYISDDGNVSLQSVRCGPSKTRYATVGIVDNTNCLGMSLVDEDEYFSIDAIRSSGTVPLPATSAAAAVGIGLAFLGRSFLSTWIEGTNRAPRLVLSAPSESSSSSKYSVGYPRVVIHGANDSLLSGGKPYVTIETETGAKLKVSDTEISGLMGQYGIKITIDSSGVVSDVKISTGTSSLVRLYSAGVLMRADSTHYIDVTPRGITCRSGSKGFGMSGETFTSNMTFL